MSDNVEQWGKRLALTILVSIIGYFLIDTHTTLKDVSKDTNEIKLNVREVQLEQSRLSDDFEEVKEEVKKNTKRIEILENEH